MILEALFHGEIYPSENVVPKSDNFRQNGLAMTELMNYFEQKLSPEDYEKLEQLCNRHCDEGNMTNEEQFKYECDYADQVSFMLDVKIIIATFKVLFLRVEEDYGKCERPHLNVYRNDMLNG